MTNAITHRSVVLRTTILLVLCSRKRLLMVIVSLSIQPVNAFSVDLSGGILGHSRDMQAGTPYDTATEFPRHGISG
jgi:hypothetical protein